MRTHQPEQSSESDSQSQADQFHDRQDHLRAEIESRRNRGEATHEQELALEAAGISEVIVRARAEKAHPASQIF